MSSLRHGGLVIAGFALAACAPAGARAPSQVSGSSNDDLMAVVGQAEWPSRASPEQLAASEAGKRAISALMRRDASGPIVLPCDPADDTQPTAVQFGKRSAHFVAAVFAASTGPDDPKVTALLRFAQALRDEHNDALAILLGIQIPARLAERLRHHPQFPETFVQLGPTDIDVVHAGQAYLACRVSVIERRTPGLRDDKDAMGTITQQRRDHGLSLAPGWFEADLALQHQFLAETLTLMADVNTGEEMADLVRDRAVMGIQTSSSSLIPLAGFGLNVEDGYNALAEANRNIDVYQRIRRHDDGEPPKARTFRLVR